MKAPLSLSLSLFLPAVLLTANLAAQDSATYKMDLIRAGWVGPAGRAYMVLVFGITPLVPDFELVLSMKFTYDVGQGEVVLDEHSRKIRMAVYDAKSVHEKDPKVYRFVRDKVDLNAHPDMFLLRVDLRGIAPEGLAQARVKYGLWEGPGSTVRRERWFECALDNLTYPPGQYDH